MSKKENFNQAVFDMFGVGKGHEETTEAEKPHVVTAAEAEPAVQPSVKEQPVIERAQSGSAEIVPQRSAEVTTPATVSANAPVVGPTVAPFSVVAATYIAPGTVVEGNIRCKGDVEIAGELKGDVFAEGDVTVRTSIKGNITAMNLRVVDCRVKGDNKVSGRMSVDVTSVVDGNVEAGELICSGVIRGDSRVQNNITLDSSAKVFGNIETDTMSMERGASISGGLVMGKHWDDDEELPSSAKKAAKKENKPEASEE